MHGSVVLRVGLAALVCVAIAAPLGAKPAHAQGLGWRVFSDASGTRVDVPAEVFVDARGQGEPPGQVLATADGRATLHIFSTANTRGESPGALLRRTYPSNPGSLSYDRVTGRFFAISKRAKGMIAYRRCNFVGARVHCVELAYPAAEKRAWDGIVTRVSLSLRPR